MKNVAKTEFYKGAGRLVTDTLKTLPPELRVPNKASLERAANRARETLRPKHPTTLDFEVSSGLLVNSFWFTDVNDVRMEMIMEIAFTGRPNIKEHQSNSKPLVSVSEGFLIVCLL